MMAWLYAELMGLRGRFAQQQSEPSMSALGQKRTSEHVRIMSALPPKADIAKRDRHVCFVPKADIPHCGKKRRYFSPTTGSTSGVSVDRARRARAGLRSASTPPPLGFDMRI